MLRQVVIFGGCGAEGQLLSDFWSLDVSKAHWTDLRQEAASLANRFAARLYTTAPTTHLQMRMFCHSTVSRSFEAEPVPGFQLYS